MEMMMVSEDSDNVDPNNDIPDGLSDGAPTTPKTARSGLSARSKRTYNKTSTGVTTLLEEVPEPAADRQKYLDFLEAKMKRAKEIRAKEEKAERVSGGDLGLLAVGGTCK